MTTPTTIERANRVSIVPTEAGFEARFVRTHKEVAKIASTETAWTPDSKMNKTLQREMFRLWICEHAAEYNVEYDPEDRRADENKMPSRYDSDQLLMDTASKLVMADVQEWIDKICEDKVAVRILGIEGEEISPVTKSRKGADVSPKYNSGAWAWATVKVVVEVEAVAGDESTRGYVTMECQLVSGQLKKPDSIGEGGYTYTGFRTELAKDIPAVAPAKKEDKPADTTESKQEESAPEPKTDGKKGDKGKGSSK